MGSYPDEYRVRDRRLRRCRRVGQKDDRGYAGIPGGLEVSAASLAHLGRSEEARAAKDELLRIMPHDNLRLVRTVFSTANSDRTGRYIEGLRKAGVPE